MEEGMTIYEDSVVALDGTAYALARLGNGEKRLLVSGDTPALSKAEVAVSPTTVSISLDAEPSAWVVIASSPPFIWVHFSREGLDYGAQGLDKSVRIRP
jgi:hypothetical protein